MLTLIFPQSKAVIPANLVSQIQENLGHLSVLYGLRKSNFEKHFPAPAEETGCYNSWKEMKSLYEILNNLSEGNGIDPYSLVKNVPSGTTLNEALRLANDASKKACDMLSKGYLKMQDAETAFYKDMTLPDKYLMLAQSLASQQSQLSEHLLPYLRKVNICKQTVSIQNFANQIIDLLDCAHRSSGA